MGKRIVVLMFVFMCVFVFIPQINAQDAQPTQSMFNEKLMEELSEQGYAWNDLIHGSVIGVEFQIPLQTVMQLKPEDYTWEQVKAALTEAKKFFQMVQSGKKIENADILSLVNNGLTADEISFLVYNATLLKKDLHQLVEKTVKEKNDATNKGKKIPALFSKSVAQAGKTTCTTVSIPVIIKNSTNIKKATNIDASKANNNAVDNDTSFAMTVSATSFETESISYTDPRNGYDATKCSPFGTLLQKENELISPASGFLELSDTDLVLPGKNGLDLDLTRVYSSGKSDLSKIGCNVSVKRYTGCAMDFFVTLNCGNPEHVLKIPYGYPTDGIVTVPISGHTCNDQDGNEYSCETYDAQVTVPTILFIEYYVDNYLYGKNYLDQTYHLGIGWGFSWPSVEIDSQNGNFLHIGGTTYKIDLTTNNGLKDVPSNEYIYQLYNNPNYPEAKSALVHKSGIVYYFNDKGHLIRELNKYYNSIYFSWITLNGEEYLDQITDTLGRKIKFTYEDGRVTLTVNGNNPANQSPEPYVITYLKETTSDGQYKLKTVQLPHNVQTSYDYQEVCSAFCLWPDAISITGPTSHIYLNLTSKTNAYQGKTVYTYDEYSRKLNSDGATENYYRVSSRYDLWNSVKQNLVKFESTDDGSGTKDYTTTVKTYGGTNSVNVVKKEVLMFNKDSENTKTETYLPNQPEYQRTRTIIFTNKVPDITTTVVSNTNTGEYSTLRVDDDYNSRGTLIRSSDDAGHYTEASYSWVQTNSGIYFEEIDSTRKHLNAPNTGQPEFAQEEYVYDIYGNILSVTQSELSSTFLSTTECIGSSPRLDSTGKKYVKVFPDKTKSLVLKVYYFAAAPFNNSDYEIRYWEVGGQRPATANYIKPHEGGAFSSSEGYDTVTITLPDPTKTYQIEVLTTKIGLYGSVVQVESVTVTYDKVVPNRNSKVVKLTKYYLYENPANYGVPKTIHQQYGTSSPHLVQRDANNNIIGFSPDNCITIDCEYLANAVEDPATGENYTNVFPSKITQHVSDNNGVDKPVVTDLRYNRLGQVTRITKDTVVSNFTYDKLGRLIKEFTWDTSSSDPKNQYEKDYQYSEFPDSNGFFTTTLSHKDGAGNGADKNVTTYYYNGFGQQVKTVIGLTAISGQNIQTETVDYNSLGLKSVVTDGVGHKVGYQYDGLGRAIKVTVYTDQVATTTPDHAVPYSEAPALKPLSFTCTTYSDSGRKSTEETYEVANNVSNMVGKKVQYFNSAGKIEKLEEYPVATGSIVYTTQYTYNYNDQVTSITDPKGAVLKYTYDFFGTKKIDYPGTLRADDEYVYEFLTTDQGLGQIFKAKTRVDKKLINAGSYIITYYDEIGRVRMITYPDGRTVTNNYDLAGRLTTSKVSVNGTEKSKIAYEYNAPGSVTKATHTYEGNAFVVGYDYTEKGDLKAITYPGGQKVNYSYDNYGRVINVALDIDNNGSNDAILVSQAAYLNNGFMNRLVYGSGIGTDFIPDNVGRLGEIKNRLMDYIYTYDGKGNVKSIASYNQSGGLLSNNTYIYNDLDWLKDAYNGLTHYVYEYDATGNRTRQTINDQVTSYTYAPGELNLLTAVNGVSLTYDKWGNITNRGNGHEYTFDDSNQLVEVKKKGRIVGDYYYNSEGKRYKKTENARDTFYVYDGDNLLYEKLPDGNNISYVYLNGKQIAKLVNRNTIYYYLTDHLGSTRIVTDYAGNVVGTVDYTPFGDEKPYFPTTSTAVNFSSMESVSDVTGRISGTVELSTDRVEGNASVMVKTGDDPYNFTDYGPTNKGIMATDSERYYYLWVKPETGADSLKFAYRDISDTTHTYEYPVAEDGERTFKVGQELVNGQWNLIVLDARQTNYDGVDKDASNFGWQTNEFSQWKWDYMGISKKDPMTYTGKEQDDPTGLYYFNARYYDPLLGRFISEDPAKDGANWYSFCNNNPIICTDPDGLGIRFVGPHNSTLKQYLERATGTTLQLDKEGNVTGYTVTDERFFKLQKYLKTIIDSKTVIKIADEKPIFSPLGNYDNINKKVQIDVDGIQKGKISFYYSAPWYQFWTLWTGRHVYTGEEVMCHELLGHALDDINGLISVTPTTEEKKESQQRAIAKENEMGRIYGYPLRKN